MIMCFSLVKNITPSIFKISGELVILCTVLIKIYIKIMKLCISVYVCVYLFPFKGTVA